MAIDPDLTAALRRDLPGQGITEKRMFGGLAYMLNGNMLCGTYKEGGMFRVAKEDAGEALAVPGTETMMQAGREMAGFILTDRDVVLDDAARGTLMRLALAYVGGLPPK